MIIKTPSFMILLAFIFSTLAAPLSTTPGRALAPLQDETNNSAGTSIYLPVIVQQTSKERVSNLQVVTPDVGRMGKFEAQFDVATQATNPSLPFDPNPPSGLKPGIGVSVDVLFSIDNWQTTLVQPAFLYQPYQHSIQDGKDHFIPSGAPRWTVRFTPQKPGSWLYRVRVQDAEGTTIYPAQEQAALTFWVGDNAANAYAARGFLGVSQRDARYFEFQDGTPFIGQGFNDGFGSSSKVEQKMQSWENNKMNFIRTWISGAGINGSQWSAWASHHIGNDGYIPGVSLDISNTYQGSDVSFKLGTSNPCLFGDFWQGGIPVQPNTEYSVWARVKVSGVSGPAGSGDYGFVIKQAGWLGTDCAKGGGKNITPFVKGSTDWIEVSGAYTTGSTQKWLDNLYLTMQNATGGNVYIDEVRVWRSGDPARVNILRDPYANSHMHFDPMNSAQWDRFIQSAENHGVYIKLVIDEKNEWIRNRLGPDGKMLDKAGNDNFYSEPGTKSRWLQQAWWRYLIARWGYSTAIHSFEYINEGDPYNGRHHEAANTMARYFKDNDPSRHMVTTSFWAAFPNREFWSNTKYSDIAYADIHAYISTGWGLYANLLKSHRVETNPTYVKAGTGSARIAGTDNESQSINPRGFVIQGAGEWIVRYWMKAEGFTASCEGGSTGGMQRVRWLINGGAGAGGIEGVVPGASDGNTYRCTSPAGSFDWKQFTSDKDRSGNSIPSQYRLILPDDKPYEISIRIENSRGTGGKAWFDEIELISPAGKVINVLGHFDVTPMDDDTAWYNRAYGDVFGGASGVGARMPLIRGETGIDYPDKQDWNRDLLKDTEGIWLHNNVWGQINAGGMYEMFWWSGETIPESIYRHFLTYRNFMEGIPLSNGNYYEAAVQTSSSNLRVWGQRDDSSGRMHLWLQNKQHTWKRVVSGESIASISGTATVLNVPAGSYRVEWWDPYKTSDPVIRTETLTSDGQLRLTLPFAMTKDLAVKISRQ